MPKELDQRQKICAALEKLARTKTISDIKVVDVCRLSGVPRTTFYYFFPDIYAVPQWIFDDIMSRSGALIGKSLSWDEAHRIMFSETLQIKELFLKFSRENDHRSILEHGRRVGYRNIRNNIEARKKRTLTEHEAILLDYTFNAMSSLTTKWSRDGMVVPVETAVQIISELIPPEIKELCDIEKTT